MLGCVGPEEKHQGVAAERGREDRMGALVLAPGEEGVGWGGLRVMHGSGFCGLRGTGVISSCLSLALER